jgi:ABC-type nitrate/sulfonate/bicarbonate transport system ATPase subunit
MPETELELHGVWKSYPDKRGERSVLEDITLSVLPQEFISVVGASGCGKSTLLNLIAGLVPPSRGTLTQRGQPILEPSAERGMVFQSYTLFPWLTVSENVGFGLTLRGVGTKEKKQRVADYLQIVGLTSFQDNYPKQLSGGMQQRVALARALINEPRVLLLDEPFGALDAQTRGLMQDFLLSLWEKQPLTVLLVTHDVGEAIYLGQKVYVLASRPGRIMHQLDLAWSETRTPELRLTYEFQAAQAQVTQWLRAEALKVFGEQV